MKQRSGLARLLSLGLLGAVAAGCAPFSNTSSSSSGSGTCGSSLVSLSSDGGTSYQLPIDANDGQAESFLLGSGVSIKGVSLRLQAYSSTDPSSLGGTLTVSILQNNPPAGTTAATPNCLANAGGTTYCPGAALESATLSLSSVALFQPKYYNFTFSSEVKNTGTSAAYYWIVATNPNSPSTTDYVAWDSGGSAGTDFLAYTAFSSVLTSNWNQNSTRTMTFQVCQ